MAKPYSFLLIKKTLWIGIADILMIVQTLPWEEQKQMQNMKKKISNDIFLEMERPLKENFGGGGGILQ